MRKNILYLLFLFIQVELLHAQSSDVSGVAISESAADAPHPSAMLDVISTDKGILIPRMGETDMQGITPPTDGLMVYVTDADPLKGFWYWDEEAGNWMKLAVTAPDDKEMIAPMGSIIMYAGTFDDFDADGLGKPGTDKEGWAVCNGKNNTPNLSGHFVVGGTQNNSEYSIMMGEGGKDIRNMTEQQMPKHRHLVNPQLAKDIKAPHTHEIYDPGHKHTYPSTRSSNQGDGAYFKRKGAKKQGSKSTSSAGSTDLNMEIADNSVTELDINFPEDLIDPKVKSLDIENRPRYYVVAYIMRTDGKPNFTNSPPSTVFPY